MTQRPIKTRNPNRRSSLFRLFHSFWRRTFSKKKEAQSICPKTGKHLGRFRKYPWLIWLFPIVGLASLIWFLIRVVPKPSRATYPCQRVAFPLASGFIIWLLGLVVSTLAYRRAKRLIRDRRYMLVGIYVAIAIIAVWGALSITDDTPAKATFVPIDPPNMPFGLAKGVFPGRVTWVHDSNATSWDGTTGYWWEDNNTDQEVVDDMISKTIRALTGSPNDLNAWDALFRHCNQTASKGDIGYQVGEKVVIKINMNNRASGNIIDASPQMVRGLLRQLVYQAGIAQSAIIVYDALRGVGAPVYDCCHLEFPQVGYNTDMEWIPYAITYSAEVTDYNARRLPKCVLDADYMINMAILKRHNTRTAVTLCAKNHFGTIGNPGGLHTYIQCWERGMGSYDPLVDIMGQENIGGKTVLYIIDGLYGGYHVGAIPTRWNSEPFNNDWPSSIFASQDPVAIDSVGLDFLHAEWGLKDNADNYLHEAAMADNPPSGTFYDPEGDGIRLASLGTHEHWNNATDKQYSRNLGTGDGIELWQGPIVSIVDFNGDGRVDFKDFSILAQYWTQNESSVDISPQPFGDGIVDFKDLSVFVENWMTGTKIPPLPSQASNPSPHDGAIYVSPTADNYIESSY